MSVQTFSDEELGNLAAVVSSGGVRAPKLGPLCEDLAEYSRSNFVAYRARYGECHDFYEAHEIEAMANKIGSHRDFQNVADAARVASLMRYNLDGDATTDALNAIITAVTAPRIAAELAKAY